ncbi:hypothetical protein, partial [Streptomyces sp. SID3343]|uniref:hypothetical protein n=1 Tax=Streptomyces sp. SID3343 TaxID=2690260 RepID=UPI00136DEB8C
MGESPDHAVPVDDPAQDAPTPLLDLPVEAARGNGPVVHARTHLVADPDGVLAAAREPAAVLAAYLAVLHRYTHTRGLVVAVEIDPIGDTVPTGHHVDPRPIRFACAPRSTGAVLVADAARRLREDGAEPGPARPARYSAG